MAALRFSTLAAVLTLAACAGFEPAGRSASDAPESAAPPPVQYTAPPPPVALPPPAPAPAPQAAAPPPQAAAPALPPPASAAPVQSAAPATPPPAGNDTRIRRREASNEVVVPGVRERQIAPPGEDPRSAAERSADIRAWDNCVMRIQSRAESDPTRPQLELPEEVCARSLGMANRNAVPDSRRP